MWKFGVSLKMPGLGVSSRHMTETDMSHEYFKYKRREQDTLFPSIVLQLFFC